MIAVSIRKKHDRNYIAFKPRPQSEVCHNNYNFVYFTLLFRTVFTAQPQETGTLYHTTSGTLTVQFAISRKNFLITPCISLSLFMMSTPLPRPIRVCVSIATQLGHWPACSIECVVDSFIDVCPYSVCYYSLYLTKSVYDVNPPPQTYKSVCINCHTTRPLTSLLHRMCCWFFHWCLPLFCLLFLFLLFPQVHCHYC